jgi:hypothetical protein
VTVVNAEGYKSCTSHLLKCLRRGMPAEKLYEKPHCLRASRLTNAGWCYRPAPTIAASEQSVDERRDRRALSQDDQSSQKEKNY